ncbi:hypothetical protein K7432_005974 [Basidiobolus ranarum]|uniref:Uncharacterized protein n=1 Tax=Basidiobolus ranarum TaxID=34480 RepID=A0ABR2WVS0_9FUNG
MAPISPTFQPSYVNPYNPYTTPYPIPYTTYPISYASPTVPYTIPSVGPVASSFNPFSTGVNVQPTLTGSVYDPLYQGNALSQATPVQVVMDAASYSGSSPPEGTYVMIKSEQGDSWLLPFNQESMGKGPVVVFGKTDQSEVTSDQPKINAFLSHRNWLLSLVILFICH